MLQRTPSPSSFAPPGPHDLINADGTRNVEALHALAHSRAINEVAKVADHIRCGRLPASYATTVERELPAALKHYTQIADVSWAVHSANVGKVQMMMISPFGRERTGVRRSEF